MFLGGKEGREWNVDRCSRLWEEGRCLSKATHWFTKDKPDDDGFVVRPLCNHCYGWVTRRDLESDGWSESTREEAVELSDVWYVQGQ